MRIEALVFQVAASSIMFSIAGAGEESGLHSPLEDSSREFSLVQSPARSSNYVYGLESRRVVSSARMITWSICSAPSSGSALSIYSRHAKADRFLPVSAMQDDVHGDLCGDDDE
jgi:hypothetical protein